MVFYSQSFIGCGFFVHFLFSYKRYATIKQALRQYLRKEIPMTIGNYLAYLGIDGTEILSEETKTERYICKAFQLKKKPNPESNTASIRIHEYRRRNSAPSALVSNTL